MKINIDIAFLKAATGCSFLYNLFTHYTTPLMLFL